MFQLLILPLHSLFHLCDLDHTLFIIFYSHYNNKNLLTTNRKTDNTQHQLTLDDIKQFLNEYGWQYQETTGNAIDKENEPCLIAPFSLSHTQGILITFSIEGEFVMVNTVKLLDNVLIEHPLNILMLNDTLKSVKLFAMPIEKTDFMDVELGFELWSEAWNQETFFAFVDLLCLGIESVLNSAKSMNIPHETKFVAFETPAKTTK